MELPNISFPIFSILDRLIRQISTFSVGHKCLILRNDFYQEDRTMVNKVAICTSLLNELIVAIMFLNKLMFNHASNCMKVYMMNFPHIDYSKFLGFCSKSLLEMTNKQGLDD